MKNTLIIGSSEDPSRYSYKAAHRLVQYGHKIYQIGLKQGQVAGAHILTGQPDLSHEAIDTVTLYLNPRNQVGWYSYLLELKPARIIFNPGAENPELAEMAHQKGIETLEACTLVMLATGQY